MQSNVYKRLNEVSESLLLPLLLDQPDLIYLPSMSIDMASSANNFHFIVNTHPVSNFINQAYETNNQLCLVLETDMFVSFPEHYADMIKRQTAHVKGVRRSESLPLPVDLPYEK